MPVSNIQGPVRGFLLDMDGVIYRGDRLIPEAGAFLEQIALYPYLFITNNSEVTPAQVAAKLARLGCGPVEPDRILTSALATAAYLHQATPGFRYFAVGGDGLREALCAFGTEDFLNADYVVVGEGPGLTYENLSAGIECLLRGAKLVGTNPDRNLDGTRDGRPVVLPGGGALVAPFAYAANVEPVIIGKPEPWLYQEGLARLGCAPAETVMIGDRPDTDIAGAARLGIRTVLVRTGRFPPGAPYPDDLPRPDYDVDSLADPALAELLAG